MGLFGPYVYITKKGKGRKFYLHMKIKGKVKLYYFSKEPADALGALPNGFEVIENERSDLPFLKKKESKKKEKPKEQEQKPAQK
jgi:hypothetical protein